MPSSTRTRNDPHSTPRINTFSSGRFHLRALAILLRVALPLVVVLMATSCWGQASWSLTWAWAPPISEPGYPTAPGYWYVQSFSATWEGAVVDSPVPSIVPVATPVSMNFSYYTEAPGTYGQPIETEASGAFRVGGNTVTMSVPMSPGVFPNMTGSDGNTWGWNVSWWDPDPPITGFQLSLETTTVLAAPSVDYVLFNAQSPMTPPEYQWPDPTYGWGGIYNQTFHFAGPPWGQAVPSAGNVNGDGTVDINDLTIVLANYSQTGMAWSQGCMDGDPTGAVDINDLTIVLANYDTTYGASSGIKAVPEPSSIVLLAIALIALVWRRRSR